MTSDTPFHPPQPRKKMPFVRAALLVFMIALVATSATLGYLYFNTKNRLNLLSTPEGQQELAKQEIALTLSRLQKLAIIPEEEPIVATIVDAPLLASQSAFYRDAQNGDQLVVFAQAQKAYIFSPSRNVIVNAGPLIIDNSTADANQATKPTATEKLTVEVRNGSSTPGKATQISQQLDQDTYQVLSVSSARNTEYGQTTIVNLSGKATSTQLDQLTTQLQATTRTALPEGETPSTADILLIVGNS